MRSHHCAFYHCIILIIIAAWLDILVLVPHHVEATSSSTSFAFVVNSNSNSNSNSNHKKRCWSKTLSSPPSHRNCKPVKAAISDEDDNRNNASLPPPPPSLLTTTLGNPICHYFEVKIPTSQQGPPTQAISVEDLTPKLNSLLSKSGMINGAINVISRHTTTAITINERESRLAQDMEAYFLSLAPPDERSSRSSSVTSSSSLSSSSSSAGVRYLHNDIDQRPDSLEEAKRCRENGWDIDNEEELKAWRDQEPINAHSHLLAMLLGSSETIPVVNGKMVIGQVR